MAEIPIYSRGVVVAHALVDDEDLELVSRYRWHLVKRVEFSHYGQRHSLGSFRTEEEAVEVAQGWLEAHA